MRAFAYQRPTSLADAISLLAERGSDARPLAGGTDLIIRLLRLDDFLLFAGLLRIGGGTPCGRSISRETD